MLNDEDPQVVLAAMLALDGMGDTDYKKNEKLLEKLIADLENPDEVARESAATALGKIADSRAAVPSRESTSRSQDQRFRPAVR